jgi:hypothetical protein
MRSYRIWIIVSTIISLSRCQMSEDDDNNTTMVEPASGKYFIYILLYIYYA